MSHKSVVNAVSGQLESCRLEMRNAVVAESTRLPEAEHRISLEKATVAALQQSHGKLRVRHDELARSLEQAQRKTSGLPKSMALTSRLSFRRWSMAQSRKCLTSLLRSMNADLTRTLSPDL